MELTISVIICTRNRFDDFQKTIPSVFRQSRLPDELVVVDSSESPQIEGYLNSINRPMVFRYFHTTPGLTLQRNHGIRKSKGDLLFFFDDDVDLDIDYIYQVEKVFKEDREGEIGAVGGRITSLHEIKAGTFLSRVKDKIFDLIRNLFGLGNLGNGRFRYSGMPTHLNPDGRSQYIECLSGCCMAFRREVFKKIEFDENLPSYGLMEDVDISKRTLDLGYRIYYEASAMLVHNTSPQNRLDIYRWAEMTVINYAYLFRKNWSKNWLRKVYFYWALIGLLVLNLHNLEGLRGTLNGMRKMQWK